MIVDQRRATILVLDDVFDAEDLGLLHNAVETAKFEPQSLGPQGLRARLRAVVEDPALGSMLWDRIGPQLPTLSEWASGSLAVLDPPAADWTAIGCNPRLRIYRYSLGGSFAYHEDEPWLPKPSTRSMLTVLVYLAGEDCVGGETVVDGEVIAVRNGRVAVFNHEIPHEGKPVESGSKLVLRTDVVYTTEVD